MENEPLELRKWIREAYKRGLIATIDDIAALPLGKPTILAQMAYTKFLYHEYPEFFKPALSDGTVHDPIDFFMATCVAFTRKGKLQPLKINTIHGKEYVPSVYGEHTDGSNGSSHHRDLITTEKDTRYAASGGSGDGHTTYILMDRLREAKMPPVFNGPNYR